MLSAREAELLAGVVAEYIRTARPVSSQALTKLLNIDVSPATVRAVLHDLEERGFLHQPHTSAGRIPTDKGYRFYVDHLRDKLISGSRQKEIKAQFEQLVTEYGMARSAAKMLSQLSQAMGVSTVDSGKDMQEAGLARLIGGESEAEVVETVREVSQILDHMERGWPEDGGSDLVETEVFIGEENPFFPAQHTSLVVRKVKTTPEGNVLLMIVGPKRMPYQKNLSLIEALASVIENDD